MAEQQQQHRSSKKNKQLLHIHQKQQLKEVGVKLLQSPPLFSKDALLKLLKQAATCLSELDQSPSPLMLDSIRPCLNAIAKPELLKHQDRDVKLLVATCMCEITRITAPEAPYSDDVLRDIFHLIVSTFSGLGDSNSPSFGRRVVILETLARYRSCVVMLDLECEDLVTEMFSTFFSVASEGHPESVLKSMQTIMILILEESEHIQDNLLLPLLTVLGRGKSDVSMAARRLAMDVIGHCAGKLESRIKQFLISSMSGDKKYRSSQLDYHEVIYDIYRCAPQILSSVIPYLTGELLADQLNTRLKVVKLLGDLFALPGPIPEAFQLIFTELLKRLADKEVEVRMSVVEHTKLCLLSNTSRREAPQIIASLCDRLLDYDENVRKHAVAALCDIACCTLKTVTMETIKLIAERLRDKSLPVKKYTMERIAEIYRIYCSKSYDGSISTTEFEWIPGKILRCFYDKDFRAETIEAVLCGSLFPMESTCKDKVKHWVTIFTGFDKIEVKALEKILEQKQRLQQEMQKYLSLRQMLQEGEASELEKKRTLSFRTMSRWFVDPVNAEESYQVLHQLKDANVWKILTDLLDPDTNFHQAWTYRDDLLQILGEKHPLHDFLGALSMKCSYLLFDKEFVKELLLEVTVQKSAGETQFLLSCMNLLVIIAHFSPSLLGGNEGLVVSFLKEDDELLKESALHILANAGRTIREQLSLTSSSVDLILERLCLEGSRKQAKFAVYALAAITKDDGLKSLSVLYKRLVDMLAEKTHLAPILQSLGCIAQIAMPIFETRESEILQFITHNILECSNKAEDRRKTSWNERSELCTLKIFALKTLLKSYLPVRDAHLRLGLENLLTIIKNILSVGEISTDIESSPVDKAHLKLASAKTVLRLSKHWDHKIPIDVFHLTLRTSEIIYPEARKQFLGKVHQYIKDKILDAKYACAFIYTYTVAQPPEFKKFKENLLEVIQMCYQAKARQHPMHCGANPLMTYPEYMLPYLVHSVAHHSSCPNIYKCTDVGAFETIYRQLHLFLSLLKHGKEDGNSQEGNGEEKGSISGIISILQSIRCSEDMVNMTKSKNSHAICDLGLSIMKSLSGEQEVFTGLTASVPLPKALYKPCDKKDEDGPMTWLMRESVLVHFESHKLEPEETVTDDEEVINDDEKDENDVPLGQMMKSLKPRGSAKIKTGKKKVVLVETKNMENGCDILDMVREINLDGLETSKNSESSNHHGRMFSGEVDDHNDVEKSLVSGKMKKQKTGESTYLALEKQRESSSSWDTQNQSRSRSYLKGMIKASTKGSHRAELFLDQSNTRKEEAHPNATDKISVDENLKLSDLSLHLRNKGSSSKHKGKSTDHNFSDTTQLMGKAGPELKMLNIQSRADGYDTNFISTVESIKRRKRRRITGLAKCSSKEGASQSLVGLRIKVWWPLDEQFYEGLVQSYDPVLAKHEILYDDGDVEVLHLETELWELIPNGQDPRKELKSWKVSAATGVPQQRKDVRTPGSLQQKNNSNKSLSPKVGWKGTPENGMEKRQRGNLDDNMETNLSEVESRGYSESKQIEASEMFTDLENKNEEKAEYDDKQVEPGKINQQMGMEVVENNLGDKEDHWINETEGKQGEVNEITGADLKRPGKEKSDMEDYDDEPLSVWRHRAGKGSHLKSSMPGEVR